MPRQGGEARMRPPGDPMLLAGATRGMAAAADELERLGRQATVSARGLVSGGGWDGAASHTYLAREAVLEARVRVAESALRVTGEGLAGLSAGLADAQATWDRARALAASSGLALDAAVPSGPLALPLPSTDPRVIVAARVSELLHQADVQASAADRTAAARLAEAARTAALASSNGNAAGGGPVPRGEADGEDGGALLGRALDLADRVGVALVGGFAAIEARAQALLRTARSGREPAAALGAERALAAFERSAVPPAAVAMLPVAGPALTLLANLASDERGGEPVLRTVVRSLGQSLGADVGQRLGIAVCGVDMGATGGAGAVLCPAITILTSSIGAGLGGTAAVRIYDALGPAPSDAPARPQNAPGPGSGPSHAPEHGPSSAPGSRPGDAPGSGPVSGRGDAPGAGPGDAPGAGPGDARGSGPGDARAPGPGRGEGPVGATGQEGSR